MDGTEKKTQPKNKDGLKKDDHRKNEISPPGKIAVKDKEWKDKYKGDEKVQERRENNRKGNDLSGKRDRFDEITAV